MLDWVGLFAGVRCDGLRLGRRIELCPAGEVISDWPRAVPLSGSASSSIIVSRRETTSDRRNAWGHGGELVSARELGLHADEARGSGVLRDGGPVFTGDPLEFSGNPSKWFQGHNATSPLRVVDAVAAAKHVVQAATRRGQLSGVSWPDEDVRVDLRRLDIALSVRLPGQAEVYDVLNRLGVASRSRLGFVSRTGTTVRWQPNSTYWSLKAYSKWDEVRANMSRGPEGQFADLVDSVMSWAWGVLRIELCLRARELATLPVQCMRGFRDWAAVPDDVLLWRYWDKLTMGQKQDSDLLPGILPPRLVLVVDAWRSGLDLRHGTRALPKNTFYRYRRRIKEATGLDISVPRASADALPDALPDLSSKSLAPLVDEGEVRGPGVDFVLVPARPQRVRGWR